MVKVLKDRYTRDEALLKRYQSDLAATVGLPARPDLLRYHEFRKMSGRFVVVSEHVAGARSMESLMCGETPLPYAMVLEALGTLARLFEFGRGEGLFQRQILLEDVLVVPEGAAKAGEAEGAGNLWKLQRFRTPRSSSTLDGRARTGARPDAGPDILFLGVSLFRMLCQGAYPLQGRSDLPEIVADDLVESLKADYQDLSPREMGRLADLFVETTTREIQRRISSYEEFNERIRELRELNPAIQEAESRKEREARRARAREDLASASDVVAALDGALVPLAPPPPPADSARGEAREEDRAVLDELTRDQPSGRASTERVSPLDDDREIRLQTNLLLGVVALALVGLVYWILYSTGP